MALAEETFTKLLGEAGIEVNGQRPFDLRIHDERTYQRIVSQGSLGVGESYMDGWWDCDDLAEMFNRVHRANLERKIGVSWPIIKMFLRAQLTNMQSVERSKRNAERHYNVGNDLYELMLDKRMVYSCGYWLNADNLDDAQTAKIDLVCRKLHLKKGMKVLDIGCGWGGLAIYAAKTYGAHVTGISPAGEQVKIARTRAKGLPVTILQKTYQEMDGGRQFDAIVSVGMLEHVGYKNWAPFFAKCQELLKPDGIMLHHTIGSPLPRRQTDPWVDKYIFPGGVTPSLSQLMPIFERLHLTVEDVQNFGLYYDRTIHAWWHNFDKNYPKLKATYDERFYRMWHYYLLSFAGMFRARQLNLWQIVLRPEPVTDVYRRAL